MKTVFYTGIAGIVLFEVLKQYLIMPMPGSQVRDSLDVAYFLHTWRWAFRIPFALMIGVGGYGVLASGTRWLPAVSVLFASVVIYYFNFQMTADRMFLQPETVVMKPQAENKLPGSRLVIGVVNNGEAKAYPVAFITYHHQVIDTVGGKPIMVTYCSVCRTGRVYEPVVNGHPEKFRLVGMDHFNAMFEDATTKSWWRQVTGEAVAGSLKGTLLPEVPSSQMTIDKWFELHPTGLVMQTDEASVANYDPQANYEQGKSKGSLTRTDSLSWKDKSWVVGVQVGNAYKAYDWNELKSKRLVNDIVGQQPIVVALSKDEKSFAAFERKPNTDFTIRNDTLFSEQGAYDFSGKDLQNNGAPLKPVKAYQEFWHSWRTFHAATEK